MCGQVFIRWLVQGLKLGFRVTECSLVFSPTRPSITTLCLAVYADTPIGSKLIVGGYAPATHPKNLTGQLKEKAVCFQRSLIILFLWPVHILIGLFHLFLDFLRSVLCFIHLILLRKLLRLQVLQRWCILFVFITLRVLALWIFSFRLAFLSS